MWVTSRMQIALCSSTEQEAVRIDYVNVASLSRILVSSKTPETNPSKQTGSGTLLIMHETRGRHGGSMETVRGGCLR